MQVKQLLVLLQVVAFVIDLLILRFQQLNGNLET